MTTIIQGQLEIDHQRGVIYFHSTEGCTVLRISRLPQIPQTSPIDDLLDITHMHGVSWKPSVPSLRLPPPSYV